MNQKLLITAALLRASMIAGTASAEPANVVGTATFQDTSTGHLTSQSNVALGTSSASSARTCNGRKYTIELYILANGRCIYSQLSLHLS
jgi:hypothetical protein